MNRIFLIVAAFVVVIGITVTVWFVQERTNPPAVPAAPTTVVPQQFDMTGGQEMQPRWNSQEERGNDAGN